MTQESLTASRRVAAGLWLAFNWRGLSQVCVDLRHLLGSVRLTMSMSSSLWFTLVTRLETRTKESNTRASHWVIRNPEGKVKVNVG